MSSRSDKELKDGVKGFAGLSSMVTDVDMPSVDNSRRIGTKPTSSASPPVRIPPAEPPQLIESSSETPAQPSGNSSGATWALGITLVIGLIWFAYLSDWFTHFPGTESSSTSAVYPSSTNNLGTANSPPLAQPTPQVQAPTRPVEERPPVGSGNLLAAPQLRYCVAEDIRLDAAEGVINQRKDSDVARFNSKVADYNSRCSDFRYRGGALESAKSDMERYRSEIAAEGRTAFTHVTPSPRAQKPSTSSRGDQTPQR